MRERRRARVLIVDDDAMIRGLLRAVLRREGLETAEAADGAQCLNLLDNRTYDVVLLDLAMPRLNGFDVVQRLRRVPRRPALIVLTALPRATFSDLDATIVHCVVRKPFDLEVLSAVVVSTAEAMRDARPPEDFFVTPDERDGDEIGC